MKLRLTRSAVSDLDEIWAYIAARSGIDAAERVVESITERFALLCRNPGAGRNRADLLEGVRSFSVGSYRIYYQAESNAVRILYIRHAARDEGTILR